MLEPNDLILQAYPLGATLAFSGFPPASILGSSSVEPFSFAFPQARRAPLSLLPDVLTLLFLLIDPPLVSLPFPWVINNLIYF
jgi:hypothetical protein